MQATFTDTALATINRALLLSNDEPEALLFHAWVQANNLDPRESEHNLNLFRNLRTLSASGNPDISLPAQSATGIEEINAVAHSIGRE